MEELMSVTRNIMASALFSMPYLGYQPVDVSNGEPAISAANITKQTILGPPFKWSFNRGQIHVEMDVTANDWGQDYLIDTVTDFGFLEQIWLTDPQTGEKKEIEVRRALAEDNTVKRPGSAAVQDDSEDGIIIRLNARPDAPYTIDAFYQRAAVPMTSLANTWGPIPDHKSYIYDWGFLGFVSLLTKDARAPIFLGKFTSHLLSEQDGLTALQRNIFLGNWLDLLTQQGRETMTAQQGAQARGNA
jgi:hypothetical protein